MDTDSLTPMAYAVLSRAYDLADTLRAELGASAGNYQTEDAFLLGAREQLAEILADPKAYIDKWDLHESSARKLRVRVQELTRYIDLVLATPNSERGRPEFE